MRSIHNLLSRRELLAAAAIPLCARLRASSAGPAGLLHPAALERVRVDADLARRARLNFDRLGSDIYQPAEFFAATATSDWPGDWEGRLILGLVLLERSTGRQARFLPALLEELPRHFNAGGYLGEPVNPRAINEQQLSGHGWLLRALCEDYEWKRDPRVLAMIDRIVRNLALPTRGGHSSYPLDPAVRKGFAGAPAGTLASKFGNWQLSSDVGCDFIFLDGISHAWNILPSPELKALIDEMVARFLEADLAAIHAQTHSSLSTLRALLRIFEQTGDPQLLRAVESRYRLYRSVAMTENFANYNWFGRPDSWTEPCAIVDSFIVATQLWRFTRDPAFLEDAHLIWFNGLGRGQRANGGYGADTCAGFKNPYLRVSVYEAYWCCTMRGGEGHARSIQYSFFTGPDEVVVPFFNDSQATLRLGGGDLIVRQSTSYPYGGSVVLEVISTNLSAPVTLRLFAPGWTSGHELKLNGRKLDAALEGGFVTARTILQAGDWISLDFTLRNAAVETGNPNSIQGYHAFLAGPLMLGCQHASEVLLPRDAPLTAQAPGVWRSGDVTLTRINNLSEVPEQPKDPYLRQVLFRES